jgi:hypothetical protein
MLIRDYSKITPTNSLPISHFQNIAWKNVFIPLHSAITDTLAEIKILSLVNKLLLAIVF